MDFDSSRQPPPSYALEDGSDNESDFGDDAAHVTYDPNKELAHDPVVLIKAADNSAAEPEQGTECVFLVGEAGERFAAGVNAPDQGELVPQFKVLVDGEQVGSIQGATPTRPTIIHLSTQLALASLHPLANSLLTTLNPASLEIIASYHAPSYIHSSASASASSSATPALLHLSTSPAAPITRLASASLILPFSPPNLLHGLAPALLTLASLHLPGPDQSSSLLLLPSSALPQPLNPPFPLAAPGQAEASEAFRDLGSVGGLWQQGVPALARVAAELGWDRWWTAKGKGGDGFAWLDGQRKARRKDYQSSMYM